MQAATIAPPPLPLDDALRAYRSRLILDAARRVFEKNGLEGASIRAIALEAGCTTGAIYPHFRGKEEVFALVLSESLDALRIHVEDAVQDTPSAKRGLRAAALAIYRYYEDRPLDLSLALYLFNGIRPDDLGGGLDDILADKVQGTLDLVAHEIARFPAMTFPPMVSLEATALFTYLVGLLTLRHSGRAEALNKNGAVLLAHYTSTLVKRLDR